MILKKTKIVATLGPASARKETLIKMFNEGVNVCRINFSHGDHQQHLELINLIRELNEELGRHVAILGDLQGPKLRIGMIENGAIEINEDDIITFTSEEVIGNKDRIYMTYKSFPCDVKPGEIILIDDGKLQFEIVSTDGEQIVKAKALNEGMLSSRKGVNLPNTRISLPSLTEKDHDDLNFALDHDIDWLGLSFVRSPRDIIELKSIIATRGKHAKVIAKIEKPEAITNLEEIIRYSDGIMVARGDLGVEIPMQDVPLIQKRIIRMCMEMAKPTIVATQMMESMIEYPSPTRAEVNDVANAVLDNADAVMLSGETSVGRYPVKVIRAMTKIIGSVEKYERKRNKAPDVHYQNERFITDSICFSAAKLAQKVNAKAINMMTHSGYTAYRVSSMRPNVSVFAFTSNRQLLTQLSLVWGVVCNFYDSSESTDKTITDIKKILISKKFLDRGDLIINIASMPIGEHGMTNMLKLGRV
jgi:pyruvate kinase